MKIHLNHFPTEGKSATIEGSLYECGQLLHWLTREAGGPAPVSAAEPTPPAPAAPRRGRPPRKKSPAKSQKQASEPAPQEPEPEPEEQTEEAPPAAPEAHATEVVHNDNPRGLGFRWKDAGIR